MMSIPLDAHGSEAYIDGMAITPNTEGTMTTYTVIMPGAFDSWFSGSSLAQGQTGGDAGMESLHAAYRFATRRRRGRRGYTLTLRLDADALDCLQDYAETSAEIHGGDFGRSCPDYRAAVDMLARIEAAREAVAA